MENKNPYKNLKCNYVYDYCDPETCNCSKSMAWDRKSNPNEYYQKMQDFMKIDAGHLEIAKTMMLAILYDNGYVDRWHSEKSQFSVKWQNKIAPVAGKFFDLHTELLTDENIEQICQGEIGETETMFGKYEGFKELWNILGLYFEDGCGVS